MARALGKEGKPAWDRVISELSLCRAEHGVYLVLKLPSLYERT